MYIAWLIAFREVNVSRALFHLLAAVIFLNPVLLLHLPPTHASLKMLPIPRLQLLISHTHSTLYYIGWIIGLYLTLFSWFYGFIHPNFDKLHDIPHTVNYKFDGQQILSVDFFFQSHANVHQPSSQQWCLRVVLRAGGTLKTDCGLEAFGLKTHYKLCFFLWAVMENEHRSLLATGRSAHSALSRSTTVLKRSSRLCVYVCVCVCVSGQLVIRQ